MPVYHRAPKGLLELRKPGPAVVRLIRRGDAEEVEAGLAAGFGVEDDLGEQGRAGMELAGMEVTAGMGVAAGCGAVEDQAAGDRLALMLGNVELAGAEGHQGLGHSLVIMIWVDGDVVAVGDFVYHVQEDADIVGIGASVEGEALVSGGAVEVAVGSGHFS